MECLDFLSLRGMSDTNGALRTAIGSAGLLLSATAHHGHPTAQCRCGAGDHPKFVGTFPDKDRSTLLPGFEFQGATRLSASHWQGDPTSRPMNSLDKEEKTEK